MTSSLQVSSSSTSVNIDTFQWQTAGNVKIQTENYNIFNNLFNYVSSIVIKEGNF